ncbi:phenylacetate--CoA ligase [Nocardioides sp. AN3]
MTTSTGEIPDLPATGLPLYRDLIDYDALYRRFPLPDVWASTVFKWPAERVRELQNQRFLELMNDVAGNPFYERLWRSVGVSAADIRSLDDIGKLPTFSSEDIKNSQQQYPPFGDIHNISQADLVRSPVKIQTSGGTTGKPRPTLYGPAEWELNGLTCARGLYLAGGGPGDILQIPATLSLANLGWGFYQAAHHYLGISPLTTGSGVVTNSRKQMETAFDYGTNLWVSFPEYLLHLAKTAREELGRDPHDLKTKAILSFLGPDTDNLLRQSLEEAWGCPVLDIYGTHEMGLGAFEGPEQDGLYLMEDTIYVEVCDVDTGEPVPNGEVGNLVVTMLHRRLPPMIRFNTCDLGRIVSDQPSVLGSSYRRMDKFLGRSDDMVKLRGVNLYPMACLTAVRSDERTSGEWVCILERGEAGGAPRDEMTVKVELLPGVRDLTGLKDHLAKRLKEDLGVKVDVELVQNGEIDDLANLRREGKPKRLIDMRDLSGAGRDRR